MSWYSADYKRRMPVLVDNRSGAATIDVAVTIPSEWGAFWSVIDDDGFGYVVTDSDGVTLLDFQRTSHNTTTRSGGFEVDAWAPAGSNGWYVLWVYWDIASPTDQSTTFTASGAKTGYIHIAEPLRPTFIAQAVDNGATVPPKSYQTDPASVLRLSCDITDELAKQDAALNESQAFEEPTTVAFASSNGGTPDTNVWDADSVRIGIYAGRLYVSVRVESGASGNDYMDTFTITTTESRTLTYSIGRNVQTPAES